MAEGGVGTCPQVFVVDSQASYVSVPGRKKSRWATAGQKSLLLLVGLALSGLVVEGCFIYRLYKRTEELSFCKSHPLCWNLSNPQTPGQHGGAILSQVGSKESNEIPTVPPHLEQLHDRPFAQLIAIQQEGTTNVVQWEHKDGETVMHKMGYNSGQLLIEKTGYYYLYTKVALNAKDDCPHFHRVMKRTRAYGQPIELMKSKSFCRWTTKPTKSTKPPSVGDDVWNSFLAGIFHLQSGDQIFVTLEKIQNMLQGPSDNLMGAFMIFPGDMLQQ